MREQRKLRKREEREAEAWENIVKDLNREPEEVDLSDKRPVEKAKVKGSQMVRQAFSLRDDTADFDIITDRLDAGGRVSGMNLSVLLCAIIIASIGLNTNSTAVIIGAMLISPLMGTIQLMGLGIATVDSQKFKRAAIGFSFQVLTALAGSTIYFLLSPIKEVTSELLGRTSPSIYDVLIASFGGLAGIIALTRKDATSNVIPGVAIATALMPPLCTCGYSIANAHWNMLGGALLLFTINTMFIMVASVIVLIALDVPEAAGATPELRNRMRRRLMRNAAIVLIITIALTTAAALREGSFLEHANQRAKTVVSETITEVENPLL